MAMWRARYVMAVGVFLLCFQTHSLLTMRAAQRDAVTAPSVATSSVATSSAPTAATGGAMRMTVLIFPSDVNGKNRAKRLQAIIDTWGAELRDLQKHQLARVVLMLSEQEAELCAPPDRSVVRSQRVIERSCDLPSPRRQVTRSDRTAIWCAGRYRRGLAGLEMLELAIVPANLIQSAR